jgi:NAD(P)-dependent dehydrogenase (short-subunit alcohol dehydrogenase family)
MGRSFDLTGKVIVVTGGSRGLRGCEGIPGRYSEELRRRDATAI